MYAYFQQTRVCECPEPNLGGGATVDSKERKPAGAPAHQARPSNQPYLCFRKWTERAKTLPKMLMESPRCGCCHPVWKTFENLCYEKERRDARRGAEGGKMAPSSIWSRPSWRGRTCVRLQHNTADDKIAYEKRQMAAVTLSGWACERMTY